MRFHRVSRKEHIWLLKSSGFTSSFPHKTSLLTLQGLWHIDRFARILAPRVTPRVRSGMATRGGKWWLWDFLGRWNDGWKQRQSQNGRAFQRLVIRFLDPDSEGFSKEHPVLSTLSHVRGMMCRHGKEPKMASCSILHVMLTRLEYRISCFCFGWVDMELSKNCWFMKIPI